jgi:CheY-like chemotaxis protein
MLQFEDIRNWTVLLIDDEPDNVAVVAEILRFYGMQVQTAHHGLEGLQMLGSVQPDLILLDLSMPRMNGWETCARIKNDPHWHSLPVIALTAHAMEGDEQRVRDAGFDGYLAKPVDIETLVSDLLAALGDWALRHAWTG